MPEVARSYRLEPLDTSGVFLGLGVAQCALLGAALLAAVAALTARAPLPVPVLIVAATSVAAFGRVGGRPAWEWLPLLAGWAWAQRRRRWDAALPLWPTDQPAELPPCLTGLRVLAVEWPGTTVIGAIDDQARQTLTAVVSVSGPQFVVEPAGEQERLLAGWGDVMSAFAVEGGPVTHLSWSELAHPAPPTPRAASDTNPAAAASYAELLDGRSDTATAHDVIVTITVSRDRLTRRRPTPAGDDPLPAALITATSTLLRGLRSAGLDAGDPLTPTAVQDLLRTRTNPTQRLRPPEATGRLAERLAERASVGPLAVEVGWDHLHTDATYHRTWWVAAWPRLAAAPTWLEPFLSTSGLTRAMTVVMVPVATHSSRRRIERRLVALDSDATTKEAAGRRVDARHRRTTQALLDREEELIAGYPEVGYCGLVTASAPTLEELDTHGETLEQLAREAGMDLQVLHGRQDTAWAAALPFGLAPFTLLVS